MDDLISLLIYAAIILAGVIASAYQAKKKANKTGGSSIPGTGRQYQQHDDHPDLGPLADIFDMPSQSSQPTGFESVEEGPSVETGISVEEEGFDVEKSVNYGGMAAQHQNIEDVSDIRTEVPFRSDIEEKQSALQELADKYESVQQEIESDYSMDEISAGEIVSVEEDEARTIKRDAGKEPFNARKAIIYSEILKRKEF